MLAFEVCGYGRDAARCASWVSVVSVYVDNPQRGAVALLFEHCKHVDESVEASIRGLICMISTEHMQNILFVPKIVWLV